MQIEDFFTTKEDMKTYLDNTDETVFIYLEQLLLSNMGRDVEFCMKSKQFESLLVKRELARTFLYD